MMAVPVEGSTAPKAHASLWLPSNTYLSEEKRTVRHTAAGYHKEGRKNAKDTELR